MSARSGSVPNYLKRVAMIYARSLLQLGLTTLGLVPSHTLRKAGLRLLGAKLGKNVLVHHGFWLLAPWRLTIGEGTVVGDHAILDARGGLTIATKVNISTGVAIWTGQHDYQSPDFAYVTRPVRIEKYVWLSFRATILPGVTVGEGAVVAAGAVVTKDVEPYNVVAGVPAKVIGTRCQDLRYNLVNGSDYLHFL